MGCGCGGGNRKSASNKGTVPGNPLIFGNDDEGLPVQRVVLLQASGGVPAGATRYIRGSKVATMIEQGAVRPTE